MFNDSMAFGPRVQGLPELSALLNGRLTATNADGARQPLLAETVPTVENGLWRVLGDGRMETTWRLRNQVFWHDGTPFTSDDLGFTARVAQDPTLRTPTATWQMVEGVDIIDVRTVLVRWKEPYIGADSPLFNEPLPRHLLEPLFGEGADRFLAAPYWSDEFVGAGPYRLHEFVRDSHIVLDAFDRYVLGRPKIDQIEVRFVPDPNTLTANVLAGQIDLTLGTAVSVEQGWQIRQRWGDGQMLVAPIENALVIYPQFRNPSPPVSLDPRFRRALMHALDRQELANSLQYGLSPVSDSVIPPGTPEFTATERGVVRYPHDPARATQLMGDLGYARGADGALQDSAGERLGVELRVLTTVRNAENAMPVVADSWRRLGLRVEVVPIPPQLGSDREWRASRPGYEMLRHTSSVSAATASHSRNIPSPANRWAGSSRTNYSNAEFDALVERFERTIPWEERMSGLRQIIRHMTEHVLTMPIFYDMGTTLVANRLKGVAKGTVVSDIQLWEVGE